MPIGHGFSFFHHGKSMLKKRGHPDQSSEGIRRSKDASKDDSALQ